MKKYTYLIAVMLFLTTNALADDFGSRFNNQTPAGLAEYTVEETPDIAMDEMATDLNDIMTAAGEEEPELEQNAKEKTSAKNQEKNTKAN